MIRAVRRCPLTRLPARLFACLRYIAHRPRWMLVLLFALGAGGSAFVAMLVGSPHPMITDEFSYLLAADTFAHGRMANPPHPMWVHFDTEHVLQWPTYASKYPPGHGLLLAAGQVLLGKPMAGTYLGSGLMCAAVGWMLRAFLPPRWALYGGIVVALQFGIASFFAQSYQPACLPVAGSALLFGSLRRLWDRLDPWLVFLAALGGLILANTRMWETFVLAFPAGLLMLLVLMRHAFTGFGSMLMGIVPALGLLATGAAAMACYNRAVTGEAFLFPHALHSRTHYVSPTFFFSSPGQRVQSPHEIVRRDAEALDELYIHYQTFPGAVRAIRDKLFGYARFYAGVPLSVPWWTGLPLVVPFVAFWRCCRNRWMAYALLCCGVLIMGVFMTPFDSLLYLTPMVPLSSLVLVQCTRKLGTYRFGNRRVGLAAAATLLVLYSALIVPDVMRLHARNSYGWSARRSQIAFDLAQSGGQHLVFVDHGPWRLYPEHWVYNAADIDQAPVVWAHMMGPADQLLMSYYPDRTCWYLDLKGPARRLLPYSQSPREGPATP